MSIETTTSPVETALITGEDLLAMGDIGRCELVAGRIVPMNPPGTEHGRIEMRLGRYLDTFVDEQEIGWVIGGEAGIYTGRNPDTVRGVDIAVISKQRLPDGPGEGYLDTAPELVVEIISPSDRWHEVEDKVTEYFSIGVEQVWVVHPRQQAVYVYHPNGERQRLGGADVLRGEGVLAGFVLPVAAIFRL